MFVLDSLYFNKPCSDLVRGRQAHVLIKSEQPSFREVLEDAQYLFANKKDVITPVIEKQGFDPKRLCAWSMEIASGVYAGHPLQIAHLVEDYLQAEAASFDSSGTMLYAHYAFDDLTPTTWTLPQHKAVSFKTDDVIRRSPFLANKKRDIIKAVEKLPA